MYSINNFSTGSPYEEITGIKIINDQDKRTREEGRKSKTDKITGMLEELKRAYLEIAELSVKGLDF